MQIAVSQNIGNINLFMRNLIYMSYAQQIAHYMQEFNCPYEEARQMLHEDLENIDHKQKPEHMGKRRNNRKKKRRGGKHNKGHNHHNPQSNQSSKQNKKPKIGKDMQQRITAKDALAKYKILVVGATPKYAEWTNMQVVDNFDEADIIMFTGGADVSPKLYGEAVGAHTTTNEARDKKEVELFQAAVKAEKKIIGICRGAQLSCVMSGGKLVQHCHNHREAHFMTCVWQDTPFKLYITSTHHQMMYPFNIDPADYRILAYSTEKLSAEYLDGDNNRIRVPKTFREPEIVLFRDTNALAIQGHPEHMSDEVVGGTVDKLRGMLVTFMKLKKIKKFEDE